MRVILFFLSTLSLSLSLYNSIHFVLFNCESSKSFLSNTIIISMEYIYNDISNI